jgi:hypothetical protein
MAESSLRLAKARRSWQRWCQLGVAGILVGAGLLAIYAGQPALRRA